MKDKIRLALFASGTGSNVFNIIQKFKDNNEIDVVLVASNNPKAGALNHAKDNGVSTLTFNRDAFYESDEVLKVLLKEKIDYIILAGFLWKVPQNILGTFENKIINVHPSLLPKFGGKGMYGKHVHEAVLENKEIQSGITIHKVNEEYDKGSVIAQFTCEVSPDETLESLQQKISELEKEHFPETIEKFVQS